jgi:hypothetical protein
MKHDYILNGVPTGGVAQVLLKNNFDVGVLRPYVHTDGRSYVNKVVGFKNGVPVRQRQRIANDATFPTDFWKFVDSEVLDVTRPILNAWGDLVSAGLTKTIPNAFGKTVYTYKKRGDITGAIMSMDPVRRSERDRPAETWASIPLPIIHKDGSFTARDIDVSKNIGEGVDTTDIRLAAQKVAEYAEDLVIGNTGTYSYGGGVLYGYKTYPDTITMTVSLPTGGSWTPAQAVADVLAMKQRLVDIRRRGPFVLYVGSGWDVFLDDDYSAAKGSDTLRDRLGRIQGIRAIKTLEGLDDYEMLLVHLSSDTVQALNGIGITTTQWQEEGGMVFNFKVMAMMLPLIRSDFNDETGIVYVTAV